jgi:hypothetical protein
MFRLVCEIQDVLETVLEDGVNAVQDGLVGHGDIVLQLLIHRLNLQDQDLVGFLFQRHQDDVFLAFVVDGIQILELGLLAVFVGEGQDVVQLLVFQQNFVVFHGCYLTIIIMCAYGRICFPLLSIIIRSKMGVNRKNCRKG